MTLSRRVFFFMTAKNIWYLKSCFFNIDLHQTCTWLYHATYSETLSKNCIKITSSPKFSRYFQLLRFLCLLLTRTCCKDVVQHQLIASLLRELVSPLQCKLCTKKRDNILALFSSYVTFQRLRYILEVTLQFSMLSDIQIDLNEAIECQAAKSLKQCSLCKQNETSGRKKRSKIIPDLDITFLVQNIKQPLICLSPLINILKK